jgi:uncharacterized protein
VSSFGRRLGRMGPPAPAPTPAPQVALPVTEPRATAIGARVDAEPAGSSLERLRARLDAALGSASGANLGAAVHVGADSQPRSKLPIVEERGAGGSYWVRRVPVAPDAAVGAVGLASAATASSALLSLLALDPRLADCALTNALYIDTETTGLSGGTGTIPFVVGVVHCAHPPLATHAAIWTVEQFFLPNLGEETGMLAALRTRIEAADVLVSYNGKSFDLPLLRTRYALARMVPPREPPHLDLVHLARRIHRDPFAVTKRGFRLTDLERSVLDFHRQGDVAGADIPAAYMHYLRTGETDVMATVLQHNHWDLLAMVALVGLYGEPLATSRLDGVALAGAARQLGRAQAYDLALAHGNAAILRGGGAPALDARARIHKARADRGNALADFEALASAVDSASVRLELAKLYEHHARDFERAAIVAAAGTGESAVVHAKRTARLATKRARAEATVQTGFDAAPDDDAQPMKRLR